MLATLIWIVIFALVTFFALKTWDGAFGSAVKRYAPEVVAPDEDSEFIDRYVWSIAAGILVATLVLNPLSMIITLVLVGVIAFVIGLLLRWALSKVH
ncbi:hypothetical protein [Halotalea alkalilenta]|uniref:hypothetical protein n=1 Tax=Halotalea alkalilenta TaxID=376489 RepID=UPI000487F3CE|nr:hypothetical protein [Halotalea alkalilenta]